MIAKPFGSPKILAILSMSSPILFWLMPFAVMRLRIASAITFVVMLVSRISSFLTTRTYYRICDNLGKRDTPI